MSLPDLYRSYIACLNERDWARLGNFVDETVEHNGRPLGLAGYRAMLEDDVRTIPDLRYAVALLVCEPPHVAARLAFDCSPTATFLGLRIDGRRVSFTENVFYRFENGKITSVWSVVDKSAIEAHLRQPASPP